jgi:ketosteroid isomerase-like protein
MTSVSTHLRAPSPKRFLWLLLLCLMAQIGLAAVRRPTHQGSKRDARHEIEAMEEQWRVAQIAGDIAAMDRLMADDFVGISMTGQANNKTQQLDRYRRRNLILTRIDTDERKIKLLGTVAVVTCLAKVEGTNEGEPLQGMYRYTRVYLQVAPGVWKTTNLEATRVPIKRQP